MFSSVFIGKKLPVQGSQLVETRKKKRVEALEHATEKQHVRCDTSINRYRLLPSKKKKIGEEGEVHRLPAT